MCIRYSVNVIGLIFRMASFHWLMFLLLYVLLALLTLKFLTS